MGSIWGRRDGDVTGTDVPDCAAGLYELACVCVHSCVHVHTLLGVHGLIIVVLTGLKGCPCGGGLPASLSSCIFAGTVCIRNH